MIDLEPEERQSGLPDREKNKNQNFTAAFVLVIAICISLSIALSLFFRRRPTSNSFLVCQSNLKNIGTALEMYSLDNGRLYPSSLIRLTPNYIYRIPTCPVTETDVYSPSYTVSADYKKYTFYCKGYNHSELRVPVNFPQYNSTNGLVAKPPPSPSSSPSP